MYIQVWNANVNWGRADEAATQWKRSAVLHKKHSDVIDCRVFRRMAGNVHVLFMMMTFESVEKRDSYFQQMPDEAWQDYKTSCESGAWDVDSLESEHYREVE